MHFLSVHFLSVHLLSMHLLPTRLLTAYSVEVHSPCHCAAVVTETVVREVAHLKPMGTYNATDLTEQLIALNLHGLRRQG